MSSDTNDITDWQGADSFEEVLEYCDEICQRYLAADEVERAEIRQAVAANEIVRNSLLYDTLMHCGQGGYLVAAAQRAESTGDYESYVRSALLAISLTDGFSDSRDTLMWLAELWRDTEAKGVDPECSFREIGEISSSEPLHMIGGPTAGMILQMLDKGRRDQLKWS